MNVQELLAKNAPTAGPPSDVEPTELLRLLMATERPSEVLPFPRNGADGKPLFQYRMVVLNQLELDQARISSERYTRDRIKADHKLTDDQLNQVRREAWLEVYEDAKCCDLLCTAMREVEPTEGKYRQVFTSANKVRELLTNDEIAMLMESYTTIKMKYGPLWAELSDDELETWLDILERGATAAPLCSLSHAGLVQLTVSLAARLSTLKTDSSSDGLQSPEPLTSDSQTSDVEPSA